MRAVFVEVDTERDWAVASLGPAFIASYLRQNGHDAQFYRIRIDALAKDYLANIAALKPDILGFSLTSRQWLRGRKIAAELKSHLDIPIIAGGLHPTFSPEAVLDEHCFDYVCLGEGEQAMCELLDCLEGDQVVSIKNIMCQGEQRPELRPAFEPIDELPFMARDCLDEQYGVVHMATQRGCPFPCTYCAARTYEDLYKDVSSYGRRRSIDNVFEELLQIRRNGQLNYVIFLDDTFTIHHPWVQEFCRRYPKEINVPFSLHARVETVSEGLLECLADAGCRHITYGVESGSERLRFELMKRPVKDERFHKVFKWTKDAGILVTANYMLGMPDETREDMQLTVDLAAALPADDFGYFVFYPYPGTALYKLCLERGYLPDNFLEFEANHRRSVLKLPQISPDDIAEFYGKMTQLRASEHDRRYKDSRTDLHQGKQVTASAHVFDVAAKG